MQKILLFLVFIFSKSFAFAEPGSAAPKNSPQNARVRPDTKNGRNNPLSTKPIKRKSIQDVVNAVQKQYNSILALVGGFEQFYENNLMKVKEASKGTIKYSRVGGKMRWEYTHPSNKRKIFFINGNEFVYYNIVDKVGYRHNCFSKETLSAAVPFLLGKGKLTESFTVTFQDEKLSQEEIVWLTLVPKELKSPVKKLHLRVDKMGKVLEVLVEDPSGGKNHFKFSSLNFVKGIPASEFQFKAPAGITLQTVPNMECPEIPKEEPKKVVPPPVNTKKINQK